MRIDMYKVIVERPRRWKGGDATAARRRRDSEGPRQLGMRAGYSYRDLNENLNPLQRYLRSQVGRPWNKVYSEIAQHIDRRNTVQQHIYQHLEDFVAINVKRDGFNLIDLRRNRAYGPSAVWQELYVDPRTGLLRVTSDGLTWNQVRRARARKEQAKVDARRRIIDGATQLHLLDGEWYEVRVAHLPPTGIKEVVVRGQKVRKRIADARFDVVLKRPMSRISEDSSKRSDLYGSDDHYAMSKRQLSRREKKGHGLISASTDR